MNPRPPCAVPAPPLRIRGARQNNLKGLDLDLPQDCLVAVTGVSGSGKSSLAFDTLFAEGQWRYLESLPTYARMLMEKGHRPAVDGMENVRPAVALRQQNDVRTARSTVGTVTELYDLFRLLFAAAGQVRCPVCGETARRWTPASAAADATDRFADSRVEVRVALDSLPWLPDEGWSRELTRRGFARVNIDGATRRLDEDNLPGELPARASLVYDRLQATPKTAFRLARALGEAFLLGSGAASVAAAGTAPFHYATIRSCGRCQRQFPEARPVLFSFNHPLGACPTCTGFGNILEWDEAKVIPDPTRTLGGGAVEPWQTPSNRWWQEQLESHAAGEEIPLEVPWAELDAAVRERVWRGSGQLEGILDFFGYLESKRYKMHVRVFLARYRAARPCPDCHGTRLRREVLDYSVGGQSIADLGRLDFAALARWAAQELGRGEEGSREILWRIEEKLATLLRLGLHYLTMDRPTRTLSGGESQRTALARQLQNRLSGTLYVLDEPTVGLHARDVDVLAEVLRELAARGNTVVAVEHDPSFIRRASHVVELGPGGGRRGGSLVYEGSPAGMVATGTPTGAHLAPQGGVDRLRPPRPAQGWLGIGGCDLHNLRHVDVAIPLGALVCVTGVSGAGKSSFVTHTLAPAVASLGLRGPFCTYTPDPRVALREVRVVDQSPMGKTPRSIPLTYMGVFEPVRRVFAASQQAQRLGLGPTHFSFNVKSGRCERCTGTGFEKLEMLFFEDLYVPCGECDGRRFEADVLAVRHQGKNIHEVLTMTVEEGAEFFRDEPRIATTLQLMCDLGLGYLVLGQPGTTLSGGEAQRLKIARELAGRATRGRLYVLDEPTTGLHPADVLQLLSVLHRLVDAGNTVVTVEHNLAFIRQVDWVIDLGPGGGPDGGSIVDTGTPEDLAQRSLGPTGRHLKAHLGRL